MNRLTAAAPIAPAPARFYPASFVLSAKTSLLAFDKIRRDLGIYKAPRLFQVSTLVVVSALNVIKQRMPVEVSCMHVVIVNKQRMPMNCFTLTVCGKFTRDFEQPETLEVMNRQEVFYTTLFKQ